VPAEEEKDKGKGKEAGDKKARREAQREDVKVVDKASETRGAGSVAEKKRRREDEPVVRAELEKGEGKVIKLPRIISIEMKN
jgi:hypothetical protein